MGIGRAEHPQLAVFPRLKAARRGCYFNVDVELREIEVGRERFNDISLLVPSNWKTLRLILPTDVEEVEEMGEFCFAAMSEPGYARCHGPTSTMPVVEIPLLVSRELVTESVDGQEMRGQRGLLLNFLADAPHMHVNGSLITIEVESPNTFE